GLAVPIRTGPQIGFSPDGSRLAAMDHYGEVWVWEVSSGKVAHRLEAEFPPPNGFTHPVGPVAFSSDGKSLERTAVGSTSLWDAGRGRRWVTLGDHTYTSFAMLLGRNRMVCWNPDPVNEEGECGLDLWDVQTAEKRGELRADGSWGAPLAVSSDGRSV